MDGTVKSLLSGFLYTVGRITAYLCLGFVTVKGIVSIPGVSVFLQDYANRVLGVLLIVVGMFLLELITFDWSISAGSDKLQSKAEGGGIHWSFILGFIFALSFCPPSAAIFFGSVIPLAIKSNSLILVPLAYGLGTGLPVMFFAVAIARGAKTLGKYFSMVQSLELYLRKLTGWVFILGGIYLTLVYVYKVI
jgi:cytochrome c biogenesis protein CcdA